MTTETDYADEFNELYLPSLDFDTNLVSMANAINTPLQSFISAVDTLGDYQSHGELNRVSTEFLNGWSDTLGVLSGDGATAPSGRASLDSYSTLTWQALEHQHDPGKVGDFNWFSTASATLTTVFGIATGASVPATLIALAAFGVTNGKAWWDANQTEDVEPGAWGNFIDGDAEVLSNILGDVLSDVKTADIHNNSDGLSINQVNGAIANFETAVNGFQAEAGEFFLEQFTINWLQEMVGDNEEIKNDELVGKSHHVADEIEFWENLGYKAEAKTVRSDEKGFWRVVEARYEVEIEVSADDGADLNGVDHFSYKIWDDVHSNQRDDFKDLWDRPEELYIETRFALDIELA